MIIETDFGWQIRCDHFRYENMNLLVIMDVFLIEKKIYICGYTLHRIT